MLVPEATPLAWYWLFSKTEVLLDCYQRGTLHSRRPVATLLWCKPRQSKRCMSIHFVQSRNCDNLLSSLFIYFNSWERSVERDWVPTYSRPWHSSIWGQISAGLQLWWPHDVHRGAPRVLATCHLGSQRGITHTRNSRGYTAVQPRFQAEMSIILNIVPNIPRHMLSTTLSGLSNSQDWYTPGRRAPPLHSPGCNTALHYLLVAYEDSIMVKLV